MKAEYMYHSGSDLDVVNAARVSFKKASCLAPSGDLRVDDQGLIKYLAKHDHWTPFAHTSITLRMQAPLPIRTQCFKHKVGLVENEESRRYISKTPTVFYPTWREKPEGSIKQGSAGKHSSDPYLDNIYSDSVAKAIETYEEMIEMGVAPEQARFVLPQGCEVEWIWTGNLVAFANFFKKRTDPHAQLEIQHLAWQVGDIIYDLFPCSWAALVEGKDQHEET